MTRIKKLKFFAIHNIDCTEANIEKYDNWWTLAEIKKGKEFRRLNFEKEVKMFKKYKI